MKTAQKPDVIVTDYQFARYGGILTESGSEADAYLPDENSNRLVYNNCCTITAI